MRPTMDEVARKTNVGIGTVSRVINNSPHVSPSTKEKVLKEIEKMGYHRNMSGWRLCTQKTSTIGVFSSSMAAILESPRSEIVRGVGMTLAQHDYDVLFHFPHETRYGRDESSYTNLFFERKIDGVMIIFPSTDDPGLAQLVKNGIPAVLVSSVSDKLDYVDIDNEGGTAQAVEHLIKLGHTRIGLIGENRLAVLDYRKRFEAFRSTLEKHGIPYREELVRLVDDHREIDTAIQEMLVHKPTAVFAFSDWLASMAVKAMTARGVRIPEDVAVAGFDDSSWAASSVPPLTTVRQPFLEMGKEAAKMLLRRILLKPGEQQKSIVPCELVVRASSIKETF